MQDKHLFEYAVIRIVPLVEREEFMNVGVVLYCARLKYLKMMYRLDEKRLLAFSDKLDIPDLSCYLSAFQGIAAGNKDTGPVARLPLSERFRWLTATRSTIVQTSKVHPGLCTDTDEMLQKLFTELVG